MATNLHRIRFDWGNGAALELENVTGSGVVIPDFRPRHSVAYAEQETDPAHIANPVSSPMCWRDGEPTLFEDFQLREQCQYFIDVTVPLSLAEAKVRMEAEKGFPFNERVSALMHMDPPRRWRTNGASTTISGMLILRDNAGVLDLSNDLGFDLRLEVACQKLGYFTEFRALLDDLSEFMAELLLQIDSPVSAGFEIWDGESSSEAGLLFQLRYIFRQDNLGLAAEQILRDMQETLVEQLAVYDTTSIEQPDVETFVLEFDASKLARGGGLQSLFKGFTPTEFATKELVSTINTPENRYVKYFLEELLLITQRLAQRFRQKGKLAASHEVDGWVSQLEEMLSSRAWSEIGEFRHFPSNSQVLHKRRGYREIYLFDLALRGRVSLSWPRADEFADGLLGDIRPVSELYEYWCFFTLMASLNEICGVSPLEESTLVKITDDRLQVSLKRGKQSRLPYTYIAKDGRSVPLNLYYNHSFPRPTAPEPDWKNSYTAEFTPDFSIEIVLDYPDGSAKRHWLHFDSKYRLYLSDTKLLLTAIDDSSDGTLPAGDGYEQEMVRLFKRDDLFKMHTYRDGILGSRGAYILFPGNEAELHLLGERQNLFVRHPSAFGSSPPHLVPSVGAFGLCPGRGTAQKTVLTEFLQSVFSDLAANAAYVEESGHFA